MTPNACQVMHSLDTQTDTLHAIKSGYLHEVQIISTRYMISIQRATGDTSRFLFTGC